MENKINVAELLKNCPKGMELDCTAYEGIVTLAEVTNSESYPIRVNISYDNDKFAFKTLSKYGQTDGTTFNKCVIFPKGKTTWKGFHRPFKDGDIVHVCDEYSDATLTYVAILKQIGKGGEIYSHCFYNFEDNYFSTQDFLYDGYNTRFATEEEKQKLFDAIKENGYCWDAETKTLEKLSKFKDGDKIHFWTIQDAKDGDVIFYDDGWTCIFKCIHDYGVWYSSYCFITDEGEFHTGYERHAVDSKINGNAHLATKERCNLLFQKIKEAGYKWNPETKTLEKLVTIFKVGDKVREKGDEAAAFTISDIDDLRYYCGEYVICNICDQDNWELVPNKFDITTLKPFDKVLVRTDVHNPVWSIDFYDGYNIEVGGSFTPFAVTGGKYFQQCIPYKGNEHLRGTTNDCDNFYKTWEK